MRTKINFKSIHGDNWSTIAKEDLIKSNERIRREMKEFLLQLKKKGIKL